MQKPLIVLVVLAALMLSFVARARAQTAPACASTTTVAAGDTLSKFAETAFGDPKDYFPIYSATNSQAITDTSYHFIDNPDQIEIGWKVCIPAQVDAPAGLSTQTLQNATYNSEYGTAGVARLTNGRFEASAEPGTPLMNTVFLGNEIAFGNINSTPYAALVLIENGGGSGVFSNLHLVRSQDGQPTDTAQVMLGDRINLTSLYFQDGQVVVGMTTQGPNDAMCCATRRVLNTYTLNGQALEQASSQVVGSVGETPATQPTTQPASQPTTTPSTGAPAQLLTRTVWKWLGSQFNDDSRTTPQEPNNYLLQFMADGTVSIKADCNQVGGTYTITGNQLTINPGPSTLVACPPGSLGNEFVRQLSNVSSYLPDGSNLVLEFKFDSGGMTFSPSGPESIAGTSWDVVNINNGNQAVVTLLEGTSITLNFGEDGQVNGTAGCNEYSGPYESTSDMLKVGPLISTLRTCIPDEVSVQERQYLAALQNAATYEISGDRLTIRDAAGAMQVVANRVTAPAGLADTSWQVTSYNNGNQGVVSVLTGTELTLNFAAGGQVSGNAGCNNFSGAYESTAKGLTIGPLIRTLKACLEPEGVMEQEDQYLAALENSAVYEIRAGTLNIRDASGATQVVATASKPTALAGSAWDVVSYNNGKAAVVSLLLNSQITLNFGTDGRVTGNAGCNNYTGGYESTGDTLKVGGVATTFKLCHKPDGVMVQEAKYLTALSSAATFEISGDSLTIRDGSGSTQVVARMRPPASLAGTAWDVVSQNNGREAVVTLLTGTEITLNFGADGQVSGNSGCNDYTGGYESTASTLKVGALASTRKFCGTPEGVMDQESQYLTALQNAATYEISGSTLTIRDASGAMQVVANR